MAEWLNGRRAERLEGWGGGIERKTKNEKGRQGYKLRIKRGLISGVSGLIPCRCDAVPLTEGDRPEVTTWSCPYPRQRY